ncbi:tRNA pseudouridine(55) synthase TruB [Lyticum sinuosum]|uniref:tRNA pseudouridine synthase B n=1 Tax=Lyticum sinuosum TaxID=1332059 RepID=A0AAE4VJZ7_9RICK|nr:tRNA pseudouridine(55) synthase TruB [Lyticum sinuosum]MDZ5761172.1 tRNA pseudouridine synthase B [Lyticum sinuosum]
MKNLGLDGWLLINKPIGISSFKALFPIKRLLNNLSDTKIKVGHAGTLDPEASGLLLVGIGKATKLMQYAVNANKEYEFAIKWGEKTTTDDHTGVIISASNITPELNDINKIIPQFEGSIKQIPPQYSSLRVNGRRAYMLARQKKEFCLKSRDVIVNSLEIISHDIKTRCTKLRVNCSSGFYIRSLARDMGDVLRCYGHTISIYRTKISDFLVENSHNLEYIIKLAATSVSTFEQWFHVNIKPLNIIFK